MRTIATAVRTSLEAANVIPVMFVSLDFASGLVNVHSGVGSISFGSLTFLGLGTLGSVKQIDEGSELQAYGVEMRLRGIPNNLISAALTEHYQGRDAKIWLGTLSPSYALLDTPSIVFAGRMDNMQIQLGPETSEIALSVENRLVDWDRPRIRRYNNADQQAEYPGDLIFEFAEQMVNKTLFWGKISTI